MNVAQSCRAVIQNAFATAGVEIGGNRPWDLDVRDERFYGRLIANGALGLGESYMEGWWECTDLAEFFCKLLGSGVQRSQRRDWTKAWNYVRARFANRQRRKRAAANARSHYDRGNDLYRNMLGKWMLYSSANWETAETLDQAGEGKLEYVCRKLGLRTGQRLVDIGCGWGGLAKYAAERYGVRVVGITVSEEQTRLAREVCADLAIEIRNQDYRDLHGEFDDAVSLGMLEHVGYKNYREYMRVVHECLKARGRFFLNTIGANQTEYGLNAWSDKYIFPGAMLPSMAQIGVAIDGLFVIEELQNWAGHYDRTLMAWFEKFHGNWGKLREGYGEQFYRMWKYYLLSSAGAFRARAIEDWMMVLVRV